MTHPVDKVRQVLDERGWTKGRFVNSQGEVCITMAISIAAGYESPDTYDSALMHKIRSTMETVLWRQWGRAELVVFNDDLVVTRTHIDLLIYQTKRAWDNDN